MATFNPIGQPHAIRIPEAANFAELLDITQKIQSHLHQFISSWASDQPDCPRMTIENGIVGVPQSIQSFALGRRREVANEYRQMIRQSAVRLWKPGMPTPPASHIDHERDIIDVMLPWIMERFSAETMGSNGEAQSVQSLPRGFNPKTGLYDENYRLEQLERLALETQRSSTTAPDSKSVFQNFHGPTFINSPQHTVTSFGQKGGITADKVTNANVAFTQAIEKKRKSVGKILVTIIGIAGAIATIAEVVHHWSK